MNENDFRDVAAMFAMNAMMTAGYWNWKEPEEDARRCYAQADVLWEARKVEAEVGIVAVKRRKKREERDA
jgi:hypothetical protein